MRFHRVRLTSLNQEPDEPIPIDSALQLEIEIWNCVPHTTINFSVQLNTIEGIVVFSTLSDSRPRPQGIVRGILQIPPRLLNNGSFSISVMAVKDMSSSIYNLRDAVVFDVQETRREGAWFGKWPGVVRPDFVWTTAEIGAGDGGFPAEQRVLSMDEHKMGWIPGFILIVANEMTTKADGVMR